MTFDDGPYPYTSQLIDTLNAAGVKATFFVAGNNGAKNDIGLTSNPYYSVVQKAFNSGHQIASHSWTHQDFGNISRTDRLNQMYRNEAALYDILGMIPTYMRPPYLDCTAASGCTADMKTLGYHIISINLDTLDWQGNYTTSKSIFNVIGTVNPAVSEFISLSHDILNQTVTDLVPYMISQINKFGYKTATIGECLGDPPVNWYRDLTGNAAGPGGNTTRFNITTSIPQNLSPDGTCGGTKGYICPESNRCCSQFGWWYVLALRLKSFP
jgi:peptidoglycan/xylan/chitin deacetylase (PgdA/CDA1 family)